MPLGSSRADASHARARDPQPDGGRRHGTLGKGWVSCRMRSGRYTYPETLRRVVSKQTTYEGLNTLCRRWHGDMTDITEQR